MLSERGGENTLTFLTQQSVLVISDHPSAPSTTIKPITHGWKQWVSVFVSMALSQELFWPLLSALLLLQGSVELAFHSIGDWIVRGWKDQLNLVTQKNPSHLQTCKYIPLHMDVCSFKHPCTHQDALTQVHRHKNVQMHTKQEFMCCVRDVWLLEQS